MPLWIAHYTDRLTSSWLSATPIDYLKISTIVIILGWVVSKRFR